jgi:hypothetical protein
VTEYTVTAATRFWIAHDGAAVVHCGEEAIGARVVTGQPTLEKFATREPWLVRLAELGFDPIAAEGA